jgi:hypothetical protein
MYLGNCSWAESLAGDTAEDSCFLKHRRRNSPVGGKQDREYRGGYHSPNHIWGLEKSAFCNAGGRFVCRHRIRAARWIANLFHAKSQRIAAVCYVANLLAKTEWITQAAEAGRSGRARKASGRRAHRSNRRIPVADRRVSTGGRDGQRRKGVNYNEQRMVHTRGNLLGRGAAKPVVG